MTMTITKFIRSCLLAILLPYLLPAQTVYDPLLGKLRTNPSSSGGAAIPACSTSPPTAGTANSYCYDTSNATWKCSNGVSACTLAGQWVAQGSSGAVTSVFTRTGAVTAQSGDYTSTQVGLGSVTDRKSVV